MGTEYALALAGGGTKGAYQVGAWRAIIELEQFLSANGLLS